MGQQGSHLKPKSIENLMRMTDFNDDELKMWYNDFNHDASNGHLSKLQFMKVFRKIIPDSDEAYSVADHVFRTFDVNHDGVLNFREFIVGLSLTMKGSFEDKLYWAFKLYDVDGNGFVSQSEMKEIITAIYSMSNNETEFTPVDQIFASMDKDHDGQVSWAEFRKAIYENAHLHEFLQKLLKSTLPAK